MAADGRRRFLAQGLTLTGAVAAALHTQPAAASTFDGLTAQTAPPSGAAAYETRSTASAPHAPVIVKDTTKIPIEGPRAHLGWGNKIVFKAPDGGALRMMHVAPGAGGAKVHYHTFHEWAYNIAGDFTNNESTHPDQWSGPLQRFVEGNFLSRPPYSLHGGEGGRQKFMASQVGAQILIMEEANVGGGTFTVDVDNRDQPSSTGGGMKFDPNYKKVLHWATPRIIHTIDLMPWQPVPETPGLNIKHLVDDPSHGFRATMWYLEAGWDGGGKPRQFGRPFYYKQAYQLSFIIAGDMNIQAYSNPTQRAEKMSLRTHYFVDRAPMAAFGLADGVVTEGGVVWLEVTYAKGTKWSDAPTPIEEPTYIGT